MAIIYSVTWRSTRLPVGVLLAVEPTSERANERRSEGAKQCYLNGINHIALVSNDIDRLRAFYTKVFDAEVGPTKPHGDKGGETMTMIRIGPHTELNVVTIEGSPEPDRQTPMWGRGRLDHFGLQAASAESFETIRQRLVEQGASDGNVNRLRRRAQCLLS